MPKLMGIWMMNWQHIEEYLDEMITHQQKSLLKCGQKIVPALTSDDMLQPNDFRELEGNPLFRYEEGLLAGLNSARIALSALKKSTTSQ